MEILNGVYTYGKGIVEVVANYALGLGTDAVELAQNLYTAIVR